LLTSPDSDRAEITLAAVRMTISTTITACDQWSAVHGSVDTCINISSHESASAGR